MTTTNTPTNTVGNPAPSTTVSPDETTIDPKAILVDGVSTYLRREAKVWSDHVDAMVDLAKADGVARATLSDAERGRIAAKVSVTAPKLLGSAMVRTMSTSTYSKRVTAGRMANLPAPAEVVAKLGADWAEANAAADVKLTWAEAFELACDHPTPNAFYDFLPKAEHLAKAKGTGRRAAAKAEAEPVSADETAEVEPYRWDDAHVTTGAKAVLANLRAQGADDVTIRLLLAEATRLVTPVRSVA